MISPGNYNIVCPQGATFDRVARLTVGGSAFDLTGYTARMQVRETYDATATLVSLTTGSGITLGGTAGTIQWVISSTASAALPDGNFVYDLELINNAEVTRLIQGKFTVTPEVTR